MSKPSLQSIKGFTFLEILVSIVIVSMTSFSLVALLKISDEASYNARFSSQIAAKFKERSEYLKSLTYSEFLTAAQITESGVSIDTSFVTPLPTVNNFFPLDEEATTAPTYLFNPDSDSGKTASFAISESLRIQTPDGTIDTDCPYLNVTYEISWETYPSKTIRKAKAILKKWRIN